MSGLRLLCLYLLLSLLLGCGEEYNGYDTNATSDRSSFSKKDVRIYGYVVDGYVENATVFIDSNLNNIPDEDEAQTKTLSNGYYELTVNQIPVSDEIEIMAYGGEDIVFKTPLKGILKAQAEYINQSEIELNLTPLSTLAVAYKTIKYDAITIQEAVKVVSDYANANDLLNDPVKTYPQNPNDLKQNIKLHNLMLSLTTLQYQNQDKENVYETYKQLAQNIDSTKTIDNITTYKINSTNVNITTLKETIFTSIQNEDINNTLPTILEDTSINPRNYIDDTSLDINTTETNTTVIPTPDTNTTSPGTNTSTPQTNTPPIAFDLNITIDEDTNITGSLHANDDDNDTLEYIKLNGPYHGDVNITTDGTFTYEVGLNYDENDSFTYKVNDGKDNSNIATVNITINPINDKPVAFDFNITDILNRAKTINWKLLSNAQDAEDTTNLSAKLNTSNKPSKGKVAISNETLTYTPYLNQSGDDTFKLDIKDTNNSSTTITLHATNIDTINPTITTPTISDNHQIDKNLTIAFSEDIDISSFQTGYITLKEDNTTNTNFTYTFTNNQTLQIDANLDYSKTYTLNINNLKDSVGNVVEQKEFSFTTENYIPIANDFTITNVGTKKTVNWKTLSDANDSVNDTLSADLNTSPSHGTVSISGDELTYTPNANIDNIDKFKLNINDTNGASTTIEVTTQDTDTIVPIIISKNPSENETDVLADENFIYKFSESIDMSSTVITIDPAVPLTYKLTDDNKTLTIYHTTRLNDGTNYKLTLENIQDEVGNILPTQTIDFTTRAKIYFVDVSSTGDGSSWANADGSLQNAINEANSQNDNRQIWVKKGTYDIPTTIILINHAHLYGGFAGNETKLKDRNVSANETILDGQNARRILKAERVTDALIDGFTFQNGKDASGAMYNTSSSYTIQNSTFRNNESGTYAAIFNRQGSMYIKNCYFYDNIGKKGGAINVAENEKTTIENSIFKNNSSQKGGAIYTNGTNVGLAVSNSSFIENNATSISGRGGAIYTEKLKNIYIKNSNFTKNIAGQYAGAIFVGANSDLNVEDSNFTQNSANNNGGVIYSGGSAQSSINIKGSNFTQNVAITGYGGVASVSSIKELNIKDSNFTKNTATANNRTGGVIYIVASQLDINNSNFAKNSAHTNGGVIYISKSNYNISNSHFTDNNITKNYGGAIYVQQSSSDNTINNTSFTKNYARLGGALYITGSKVDINNSHFAQNSATTGGVIWGTGSSEISFKNSSFIQNNATDAGALGFYGGKITLDALTFYNNNASNRGGGLYMTSGNELTLTNSTFSKNSSNEGGGVYASKPALLTIANVTFSENITNNTASGTMQNINGTVNIYNSIFYNNNSKDMQTSGTVSVNNSIVQSGFTSGSNISTADPLLEAHTQNGIIYYYNLGIGSSAIDKGNNANMTLSTDQIGNPRIVDTKVDIGAIEMQ